MRELAALRSGFGISPVCFVMVLFALPAALVACGSSGGNGSSGRYVDSKYGFSFIMPKGWSAPSSGSSQSGQGYSLVFTKPVGFQIQVGTPVKQLLNVPNGRVVQNAPPACPQRCEYLHLNVSGRPAIRVVQTSLKNKLLVFADYVIVNSAKYSYNLELRMVRIEPVTGRKFQALFKSFKISSNE